MNPFTTSALHVENLAVSTAAGIQLVDGITLAIGPGQLIGLLGETGAGKTLTGRAMLGLLPRGLHATGRVRFADGPWIPLQQQDVLRDHLGRTTGLMLQNPTHSFDPRQRIGPQLIEAVVRIGNMTARDAAERAAKLCTKLGLHDTDAIFRLYPHQLSGGMAQRVALALALMPAPQVLVVDEPTSALDANLRIEALELIHHIARDNGTAIVLISHDIGLVGRFCDRIAIMYAGHLTETGPTTTVLNDPAHPYTRTLTGCALRIDAPSRTQLPTIAGEPPQPGHWPTGCYFHPRCPIAEPHCRIERPEFLTADASRGVACHLATLEVGT